MNKLFKLLYKNTPASMQNLFISIYGYKLLMQRYGKHYNVTYKKLLKKDYSSFASLQEEQNKKLREFLSFAINNSIYFEEKFAAIDISKVKTVSDLHLLPVLTKEELRTNVQRIMTIKKEDGIVAFTGGTTGKSLEVVFTKEDMQFRMAFLDAFKQRLGIDVASCKKATFSGREVVASKAEHKNVFWRHNAAYKQRLYSTFHLRKETMNYYIGDLMKYKPEVINGFVSAIYEIAEYIERNDIKLNFVVKGVFTTSETLLEHHRTIIEKAFNTKVYNQYASAEGAPFITECKEGELHYCIDTGVIEVHEVTGEILVTSFFTHGTPLIRYAIGDKVEFKSGVCKCGSAWPLVKKIEGRQVDYLNAKDGTKVSLSHLSDVIKGLPNCVEKIQFIQDELLNLEIKIIADKGIFNSQHANIISDAAKIRFGDDIIVAINLVEDIPREKSGKYSIIKRI
ncbi:MAG: phenylacetate-CoA ligase [Sediminicola sp.]